MQQPLEMCLEILDLRAYARTKQAIDQAAKLSDIPAAMKASSYYKAVAQSTQTLVREQLARKK